MIHYLKHLLIPIVMSLGVVGMALGGPFLWFGFASIMVIIIGGDAVSPDDLSRPVYRHKWLLNGMLYGAIPITLFQFLMLAWIAGRGSYDLLHIGVLIQNLAGFDAIAARNATLWYHYIGAVLGLGLVTAGYATNVAHELTHRTWDPIAWGAGRFLLGTSLNPDFAIEHIYGHHVKVGTQHDPAQARRGENLYRFIIRSSVFGHVSAWKLEQERLRKKRKWLFSISNRMLTGYLICAVYITAFAIAGGWLGVVLFVSTALFGKAILEAVNYMEHYGLIRVPGEPIKPRHSWNTNKLMSSLLLFSLTRHSAHHEKGDLPFWELKPYPEAPEMPFGYLTTLVISIFPPLWDRVITPALQEWDEKQATPAERKLAREQNLNSGIRALRTYEQSLAPTAA